MLRTAYIHNCKIVNDKPLTSFKSEFRSLTENETFGLELTWSNTNLQVLLSQVQLALCIRKAKRNRRQYRLYWSAVTDTLTVTYSVDCDLM